MAMQTDDQFHIFSDCVRTVTSHLNDGFFLKHPKCPGYDKQCVQGRPTQPPEQERTEIFHNLEERQDTSRQPGLKDVTTAYRASVGNPHSSSSCHCRGII